VLVQGRSLPFPDDRGTYRMLRFAREAGWERHARIPLPDGGRVEVYTHPDSMPNA
jgi:hypothetical protein